MAEVGDTVLHIAGPLDPGIGDSGVDVDLADLVYTGQVWEYLGIGPGWFQAGDISSVSGAALFISPAHSTGFIATGIVDNRFTFTVPSNVAFSGFTGYEWSFTMTITHGTNTFGEVTRGYSTTDQIEDAFGNLSPAMTFTTGAFDVVPNKPTNPAPTDTEADVVLSTGQVSWDDGGGADTFDVYFGPTGNMTLRSSAQAGTTWDIPLEVLFYETGYEWRIDATNAQGTTTGDTWSFDTIVFDPPLPSGEVSGAGGEHGGEGGKNNMVTVKRLVAAANNTIFFEDE